jgi:hypothetical protein
MVALAHRVLAQEGRLKEHLGVRAGSLAGGRAVVVPQRKLVDRLGHAVEHAGLGAVVVTAASAAADPDVLGLDLGHLQLAQARRRAAGELERRDRGAKWRKASARRGRLQLYAGARRLGGHAERIGGREAAGDGHEQDCLRFHRRA